MQLPRVIQMPGAVPRALKIGSAPAGAGLASAVHLARSRNQQAIVFVLAITFFLRSNKKMS
jgi:phosphoribosylcarboxyaminoimidazole (NCAIR) mutase